MTDNDKWIQELALKVAELESKYYNIIKDLGFPMVNKSEALQRIEAIEKHPIFQIWNSIRGGGKSTLDALLLNAKGIRESQTQIESLRSVVLDILNDFILNEDISDSTFDDFGLLIKKVQEKEGSEKETDPDEIKAERERNKEIEKQWALDDGRCDCIHRTNCDELIELCNIKCQDYKKEHSEDERIIIDLEKQKEGLEKK